MPQNAFLPWTCNLLICNLLIFSTLHPLSPVIFATATEVAFVLLCNSRFNFHCYTQPTQKSARKWPNDISRLLARKITKGIHSCKPTLLNRPIGCQKMHCFHELMIFWSARKRCKDISFYILHHLSPVILADATVAAYLLLCSSRFSFHC